MRKITSVKHLTNYEIRIRFDNGKEGIVSLADLVGKGVFKKLKDPKEFAKVTIDPQTHTLTWPGGIDLCPDSLYQDVAESPRKRVRPSRNAA